MSRYLGTYTPEVPRSRSRSPQGPSLVTSELGAKQTERRSNVPGLASWSHRAPGTPARPPPPASRGCAPKPAPRFAAGHAVLQQAPTLHSLGKLLLSLVAASAVSCPEAMQDVVKLLSLNFFNFFFVPRQPVSAALAALPSSGAFSFPSTAPQSPPQLLPGFQAVLWHRIWTISWVMPKKKRVPGSSFPCETSGLEMT